VLKIGASRSPITPPRGTWLAGYRARASGATGVHDELFVRVLAFDSGGERFAVVSLDVMAVDGAWVRDLRGRAATALNLPPDHLLVAATHTHAAQGGLFSYGGPVGHAFEALMGGGCGRFDPEGSEHLLRQTLAGLVDAFEQATPATLEVAEGAVQGIASNRVWQDRAADDSCLTLVARDDAGQVLAVLVHFTCHPTVLGEGQTAVSGDFAGAAMRIVEEAIDADAVALFLNGALGDISTRFTRRDQTYDEVQRFGRMLADDVLDLIAKATLVQPALRSAEKVVDLPPLSRGWRSNVQRRVEELAAAGDESPGAARQLSTAREGAESAASAADAIDALEVVPIGLQALWLTPELALCAVPGELFSAAGAAIDAAVPDADVRVVTPANGYLGYLPTRDIYEAGGYEVGCSLVDHGAAESLSDAAIELLMTARPLTPEVR
jgi:neutral ceramidase